MRANPVQLTVVMRFFDLAVARSSYQVVHCTTMQWPSNRKCNAILAGDTWRASW